MKTKFDSWLIVLIFVAGVMAYLTCLTPMVSFYESISTQDYYENIVHMFVQGLAFPALFSLLLFGWKRYALALLLLLVYVLVLVTNSIYYGYFESLIELRQVTQAAVLPHVSEQVVDQLMTWRELVVICDGLVMMFGGYCIVRTRTARRLAMIGQGDQARPRMTRTTWILGGVILLVGAHLSLMALRNGPFAVRSQDSIQLVKQMGFPGFYGTEIALMMIPSPELPEFPGRVQGAGRGGDTIDVPGSPNIIFLQVESLDARLFEMQIDGLPLLENLQQLKQTSIYFPNFFAQHRGGASQDSEFSTLLSLIPTNGRSGFNYVDTSAVESLSNRVGARGYFLSGFHGNSGSFFNREKLFRDVGFDDFVDADDYQGTASGWRSNDLAFFEQTVPLLEKLPQPFFAYLITMQSHGPFDNVTSASANVQVDGALDVELNYYRSLYEVDLAIGRFVDLLDQRGLLDQSILIIYADHASGLGGTGSSDVSAGEGLPEHIPLMIRLPNGVAGVNPKVGSQLDLAPTLADLLGFGPADHWMGTSLFDGEPGVVILNFPVPLVLKNNDDGTPTRVSDIEPYRKFVRWSEALQGRW